MTVCIAALANAGGAEGPVIITASDRMITIDGIGYEPNQTKIVQLAGQTVGLLAGDMQLHAAVVPKVMGRVREAAAEEDRKDLLISEVADFFASEFSAYSQRMAEREVLAPRNLSFEKFVSRSQMMPHYQVRDIDNELLAYRIESYAIIAGIDHTGGHIFKVRPPGVADCYDTPFFACAGRARR
jgi:hypothetical protein